MKSILNFLPVIFFAAAAYCGYLLYSAENGLMTMIPLTLSLTCAFVVSLAWRISPAGIPRVTGGISLLLALVTGAVFCNDPSTVRTVWVVLSLLVIVSVHAALFAIAASSFLFTDGRIAILFLPVLLSATGVAGLFLWNGSLALSAVGLAAAVIFALIATLFGMQKTKKRFQPEDN